MRANQTMTAPDGKEVCLFPFEYMYMSQDEGGDYSHAGTYAIDFLGWGANGRIYQCPFYAPCSLRCVDIWDASNNNRVYQSLDKVHLADGSLDYLTIAFAHDDSPLYGIGEVHVHFAAELYYEATGVVKTKMSSDEFRKTYLIPLKILECLSLSDVNAKENVNVFLVDKNVKGVFKCRPMEVYYGEKGAKDVFYDVGCALYNQFDEARTEFYLDQYDSIAFRSHFRYNGDYGPIGDFTGIVTIAPKDPKYGYQKTVRPVRISHWDGPKAMYSSPHGGLYEGFCRLVGKEVSETDINRPVYDFKTGTYEVNFYIWGQLMWTGEIKFTKTQCEFDRYLDEYIRAVNSGAIKLSEDDSADID